MGWRARGRKWLCSELPGPSEAAQLEAVLYSPPGGTTRETQILLIIQGQLDKTPVSIPLDSKFSEKS